MEVSCTAGSLGARKEPDVCTSSYERETSIRDKIDIDPNILTETSAVLKEIVNTIEKYSSKKESVASSTCPFIKLSVGIDNLQTKCLKEPDTAVIGSSQVEQSGKVDRIKTDSELSENNATRVDSVGEKTEVDEYTVINNETKECTVLPFVPLTLNSDEVTNKVYERNNIQISKNPIKVNLKQTVDSGIDACTVTNYNTKKSTVVSNADEVSKQNRAIVQKLSKKGVRRQRKAQSTSYGVIDQLFDAARKGDKDDFKRILYVNYDNIVNDYIDNSQSDSCASTSEETIKEGDLSAPVKDTVEVCDNQSSDLASDIEPCAGTSVVNEKISNLGSKLVICDTQEVKSSDSGDIKSESDEISKPKGVKQKQRRIPDFKEISRKVAAKKFKTSVESDSGLNNTENGVDNSKHLSVDIKVDQNKNYTGEFVDVETVKQEADTEDYFASSELDESISQSELSADESAVRIKVEELTDDPTTSDSSFIEDANLKFICQHCDKKYRNLVHLRSHQSQHHFYETRFTCEACSDVFSSLDKLKEHEKVHVRIDDNYCELCKKSYSSKPAIRRHAETVHVVEKRRPHQCEICDFAFACRWHLREHLRIHTGQQ